MYLYTLTFNSDIHSCMLLLTYTFVNFCILKMIFHRIVCYWLHIPYVTCSYNEARERSPWAGYPSPLQKKWSQNLCYQQVQSYDGTATRAGKKYSSTGSRKLCITKHKTFSWNKIIRNYILYKQTGHNNLSEIGISLSLGLYPG